jgi:hypothetical protein
MYGNGAVNGGERCGDDLGILGLLHSEVETTPPCDVGYPLGRVDERHRSATDGQGDILSRLILSPSSFILHSDMQGRVVSGGRGLTTHVAIQRGHAITWFDGERISEEAAHRALRFNPNHRTIIRKVAPGFWVNGLRYVVGADSGLPAPCDFPCVGEHALIGSDMEPGRQGRMFNVAGFCWGAASLAGHTSDPGRVNASFALPEDAIAEAEPFEGLVLYATKDIPAGAEILVDWGLGADQRVTPGQTYNVPDNWVQVCLAISMSVRLLQWPHLLLCLRCRPLVIAPSMCRRRKTSSVIVRAVRPLRAATR